MQGIFEGEALFTNRQISSRECIEHSPWGTSARAYATKKAVAIQENSLPFNFASFGEYGLGDYKARFGTEYFYFHKIDMHTVLSDTVKTGSSKELRPQGKIIVNHKALEVDAEKWFIRFENGNTVTANLIIAADGIRSLTRQNLGITPSVESSTSCCYRCIIQASKLHELGLLKFALNNGIEFWGGFGVEEHPDSVFRCLRYHSASYNDLNKDGWNISARLPRQRNLQRRILTLASE
ncbi:hypothetical protein N431DRAFT_457015 [Stipitochalara longipes BDJ]|nr:hypothetical protein N431DRAFT_457015 [Stipitochalara longipes BDJ]